MKKTICVVVASISFLSGCGTKTAYKSSSDAPHVMTVVDQTNGYVIYRHDETGIWYFARRLNDGGVCVMVNPDGTPYSEYQQEGTE